LPGTKKFATGKGSAYKTVDILGGRPKDDYVWIDLGWTNVEVFMKNGVPRIKFTGGKEAAEQRWREERFGQLTPTDREAYDDALPAGTIIKSGIPRTKPRTKLEQVKEAYPIESGWSMPVEASAIPRSELLDLTGGTLAGATKIRPYQGKTYEATVKANTELELRDVLAEMEADASKMGMDTFQVVSIYQEADGGYAAEILAHNWNPFKWVKQAVGSVAGKIKGIFAGRGKHEEKVEQASDVVEKERRESIQARWDARREAREAREAIDTANAEKEAKEAEGARQVAQQQEAEHIEAKQAFESESDRMSREYREFMEAEEAKRAEVEAEAEPEPIAKEVSKAYTVLYDMGDGKGVQRIDVKGTPAEMDTYLEDLKTAGATIKESTLTKEFEAEAKAEIEPKPKLELPTIPIGKGLGIGLPKIAMPKDEDVWGFEPEPILAKQLLEEYSIGDIKVYKVKGFKGSGSDLTSTDIPKDEIWISSELEGQELAREIYKRLLEKQYVGSGRFSVGEAMQSAEFKARETPNIEDSLDWLITYTDPSKFKVKPMPTITARTQPEGVSLEHLVEMNRNNRQAKRRETAKSDDEDKILVSSYYRDKSNTKEARESDIKLQPRYYLGRRLPNHSVGTGV